MDLFNNSKVKDYIAILKGHNSCRYVITECQCIMKNLPKDAHIIKADPFSSNMAELAARQEPKAINLVAMYISDKYYFNVDTMKFLSNEMLICKNIRRIDQYYNVLDQNFRMHPPCASYMTIEYEHLMLENATNYFGGMIIWDYLMDCLHRIASGSIIYGINKAFDLAFYRFFQFCVNILQMEYVVAKNNGTKALIIKCLDINSERQTKLIEITKILDILFSFKLQFQVPVVQLALLVREIKQM